jgi:hypothetical protein
LCCAERLSTVATIATTSTFARATDDVETAKWKVDARMQRITRLVGALETVHPRAVAFA